MKWNFIYFLSFLCFSCQKEALITMAEPSGFFSMLTVEVIDCKTIHCEEFENVAGLKVELYQSYDDARNQRDRVSQVQVNLEGQSIFTVFNLSEVFIRLKHPTKGIYISSERLNPSVVNAFHEIRFVGNFIYNESDELQVRQTHISFGHPSFSQQSLYRFHYQEDTLNLLHPTFYEDISLVVTLSQQVSENEFLVSEKFTSVPAQLSQAFNDVHENIWTFDDNSISILPVSGTRITSPILGVSAKATSDNDPIVITLVDCDINLLDIENNHYSSIEWSDCMHLDFYDQFDMTYQDISLFHKIIAEGHEDIIFFSQTDGILRNLNVNLGSNFTYGFDLDL